MRVDRRSVLFSTLAAATGCASPVARAQQAETPIEPLRRPAQGNVKVAILVDVGTNMMDFTSAWEPLSAAGTEEQHCEVYTVSAAKNGVHLGDLRGIPFTADYSFDDAPQPHLVVMGAQTGDIRPAVSTPQKSEWLRAVAPNADVILSICTGAFVLARSGLIDGKLATTHHSFYDRFAQQFPQVQLVRDRRFVDNGKFVSAGGLTSGIDATLHVIARYWGAEEATTIATYFEHYSTGWRTGLRTNV